MIIPSRARRLGESRGALPDQRPGYQEAGLLLAASLALGGKEAEAREAFARVAPFDEPRLDLLWASQWLAPPDRARLKDGLRRAGWAG